MNIILIILNVILNGVIFYLPSRLISNMSVLSFLGLIYLMPVCLNCVMTILLYLKNGMNRLTKISTFIFPLFSMVGYYILGMNLTTHNSQWMSFIKAHNINMQKGMYIHIGNNLNTLPFLFFALILFFGIQFICYLVMKKRDQKHA